MLISADVQRSKRQDSLNLDGRDLDGRGGISEEPLRLLGIQIGNGYLSEARVFASLMRWVDPVRISPHVFLHSWDGDEQSAKRFCADSGTSTQPLDFGWRSMAPGRPLWPKLRERFHFARTLLRATRLARTLGPDVIYSSQQTWDCFAAAYIARRLKKSQIIHLHYTIGDYLHRPVLQRLRDCAHVLTVSDFIREQALAFGVPPQRVTTLHNTISVQSSFSEQARRDVFDAFRLPYDTPLLGLFSRMDPYKGQEDTVRAFQPVVNAYPTARLLLAGGDTAWHPGYTEKMKMLAAELQLSENVLFLGNRSDVPQLLNALDIFVHPSRMDPCPLAPLEAAAAGVPVIAYAEGGIQEIICNEREGLLVPPGNIHCLSDAMLRLLGNAALRKRMGKQAQEHIAANCRPEQAGARLTEFLIHHFAPASRAGSKGAKLC